MAIVTFDIDAASVQEFHFPQSPAFSDVSAPTEERVNEIIEEEAATLTGALLVQDIIAANISETSPAYAICARQVRQMAALRCLKVMVGQNPELAKAWADEIDAWFKNFEKFGALFLGDKSLAPTSAPTRGPLNHVTANSLTRDTADDMSSAVALFRRSDVL